MNDVRGDWRGYITGTNFGQVLLRIAGEGDSLEGTIDVEDREFGKTCFVFVGTQKDKVLRLRIMLESWAEGVQVKSGTVVARLQPDGTMAGIWETELGTAGKVFASKERRDPMSIASQTSATSGGGKAARSSMTPLWVISLFVSLSEIMTSLAVTRAEGGVQVALTVFVVVFPILVAAAFFTILWKKPYVFYPPTEFGASTNVSEYVQALAGLSPTQAAESQRQLAKSSSESSATSGASPSEPESPEARQRAELAETITKYFAFKRMRYSDVSNPDTRALFNLGSMQEFNLFDGVPGITFFGFFWDLDPAEIVARVRFLLNNIDLANRRISEQADSAQRDAAQRILDQLHIEVLAAEDADVAQITSKIEEFRPEGCDVDVAVLKPSEVERIVLSEYENMGIEP